MKKKRSVLDEKDSEILRVFAFAPECGGSPLKCDNDGSIKLCQSIIKNAQYTYATKNREHAELQHSEANTLVNPPL
jgi:hypothetical protein